MGAQPSGARVIDYEDVVQAAAALLDATGTVDLTELVRELAVSRATLYRVIPGRDRVLGDVLWHFADAHHRHAAVAHADDGLDRFVRVLRSFGEAILSQRSFRAFLHDEPEVAARVLFTPAGGVHERFVAANARLLRDCANTSGTTLPFDVDTTAYVLSRIYESIWYADLISGREPDLDVADQAARAVLGVRHG